MFKLIRKLILLLLLIVILIVGLFVGSGYKHYKDAIEEVPLDIAVTNLKNSLDYTSYDIISKDYLNAVVAIEDQRFYTHGGIDIIALARTTLANIRAKEILGGGSTITQQLAKNFYFMNSTSITRKISEMFVAMDLESQYEKEEILEMYVNIIYFGDNYYGIYDASVGYFNTVPSNLSLSQASMLAGLPQAPSIYALSNNNEASYRRQEEVLKAMLEAGYIDTDAFIEAVRDELR